MLILVGVTVAFAMNGGLFRIAKEASDKTILAKDIEELTVAVAASYGSDGELHFDGTDGLDVNAVNAGFEKKSSGLYMKDGYTFKVSRTGKITTFEGEYSGFTLAELAEICDEDYYINIEDFAELTGFTIEELEDEYIFSQIIDLNTDSPDVISTIEMYSVLMEGEQLYQTDQEAAMELIETIEGKYSITLETHVRNTRIDMSVSKFENMEMINIPRANLGSFIQTYGDVNIQLKTKDDVMSFFHDMSGEESGPRHIDEDCNGICDICGEDFYEEKSGNSVELGDMYFYISEENNVKIASLTAMNSDRKKAVIPGTITVDGEEYTVNSIQSIGGGSGGFQYLKSITIPNTVTNISSGVFSMCPNLETITITGKSSGSISGAPWKGDGWTESVDLTNDCVHVVWSDQTDYYVYGTNNGNGGGGGNQSNQGNGS